MSPFRGYYLFVIVLICICAYVKGCYRRPQGATGDPSPVDENYQILINANPSTYHPGQQYNITLACDPKMKYISFTLLIEAEDPSIIANHETLGTFFILDKAETKFSDLCNNMVESNNNNIKESVTVAWTAPSNPKSGCVLFKAAVLQQRDVWFMDGGFLTKRLCPEEIDEINSLTPPVNPCCACDEAKYEIVLERKWTRNSHPKDFPLEAWRTKFGNVIGASHSVDYKFWEYGTPATSGLKQLAEHGSTRTLEEEIKYGADENSGIRTIIKAPGVDFKSNVISKTLANVRVSPRHHQISLVTKIEPSPDWILGVASLELCLINCTWVDKKILNLYPWDVGTDAGPSYMSADQAQKPPDVIRRISSTFPNDVRSPFYDAAGAPMNAMATLKITRKRTYERPCVDVDLFGYLECAVHPWQDWNECSAKCGSGKQFRERNFKNPEVAKNFPNCTEVRLKQIRNCVGSQCGLPSGSDARSSLAECEVRPWSQWTPCSKKCGKGYQTRNREYSNAFAKDKCQSASPIDLVQTRTCNGNMCGGNIGPSPYDNSDGGGMYGNNYGDNSNSNMYPGSSYDNQRGPPNRYGDSQRTSSYNPYDSSSLNPYDNSDMNSQISTGYNNNDYSSSGSNMYGNNQMRANGRNPYDDDNNKPLFGDLETSYDDTSPFGNTSPFGANANPRNNARNNQTPNIPLNRYGNINTPYQGQTDNYQNQNQNLNSPTNRYGDMGNTNQYSNRYGDSGNDNIYNNQNTQQNQYDNMGLNSPNDNNYQNQYDSSSSSAYNQNSYNNPRITTPRSYGSQTSYTTPRSNFYDISSSSSSFDNMNLNNNNNNMDFGNPNDPNLDSDDGINFCQQKPIPYDGCNAKRIIIKNYWFYDADDGQCKLFTADNCDQNRNKFFSLESCERACSISQQSQNFNNDPNMMNPGSTYGNGMGMGGNNMGMAGNNMGMGGGAGNGGYDQMSGFGNSGFDQTSNYGMQRPWRA